MKSASLWGGKKWKRGKKLKKGKKEWGRSWQGENGNQRGLWGSANKNPVWVRVLDLRVGSGELCNEMYASSSQRRIRRSVLKVPYFYVLRRDLWNGGKHFLCCTVCHLFGENFPPLISHNSNHFLLLWHHNDGPLPLMLSPQRWLHARPLSLALSTPPLWPVCTSALARDTERERKRETHTRERVTQPDLVGLLWPGSQRQYWLDSLSQRRS